ncbi:MAG: hypothetical protein RIQ59_1778 [Bacteroidota bacterium]|jgi:hypothetical protein
MKKIIVTVLILSLSSCSIQGLTNDYGKLTTVEKSKIVPLTTFENLSKDTIYTINASQLKAELLNNEAAMVYEFTNGCTSEYCRPLKVYEIYAKKHHYKLYLVMNGFANIDKTKSQNFSSPLFAIDGAYYKKSFRSVYTRYFDNELRDKPINDKEWTGGIFIFEKGKYIKTLQDLPKED